MKENNNISAGNLILISTVLLGCIAMFIYPSVSLNAARNGIGLWFNSVLPALLPFFICSNFLSSVGIPKLIGKFFEPLFEHMYHVPGSASFVFLMSIMSGYPVGPKIISDMRKGQIISKSEAQRMLAFCSTSGPLFMLGAVGAGMFGNAAAGWIIAVSHYLGAVFNGFAYRFYGKIEIKDKAINYKIDIRKIFNEYKNERNNSAQLVKIFTDAMIGSFKTLAVICGYIVLFSMAADFLTIIRFFELTAAFMSELFSFINPDYLSAFLKGFLEMTIGCSEISKISGENIYAGCILCAMLISWSGISVHAQVASILSSTDISGSFYILTKATHSLFSGLIAFAAAPFILKNNGITAFAFGFDFNKSFESFFYKLLFSAEMVVMLIILLFVLAAASWLISCLSKKNHFVD